jgi:hypothetical protein
MRYSRLVPALLVAALAAGCSDLDITNPNTRTTDTFWKTQSDAIQGINGTYNGLQLRGTYRRWLAFAYDIRSDIGQSPSPWPELNQFNKFTLGSYDFEVNLETYGHHYQAIFRANQVIAYVPDIPMDAALKEQLVGEAKFIRGLLYFNLANLYGSVPLILTPSNASDRPASATPAEVWAQVEKDFTEARAALPATPRVTGSATRYSAGAMLGKAHLQQREWQAASQAFGEVIASGRYALAGDYASLFRESGDNSQETIFEVQFGGPNVLSSGTVGLNVGQMIGPCGPSFCDAKPTPWYFQEFLKEPTATGGTDPRLDATIFYNKPGGMDVFGQPYTERYGAGSTELFWKKYTEYYNGRSDWDAAINYKVVRLGGLLLNHAEALNEAGSPEQARPFVNQVRQRAGLTALPAGMSQAAMRAEIEHQTLLELGLEMERWLYLARHNLLATDAVEAHDPTEFRFFVQGKSERLPIPTEETARNPNVTQNPGW